jgi:hypothetical protein
MRKYEKIVENWNYAVKYNCKNTKMCGSNLRLILLLSRGYKQIAVVEGHPVK